LPSTQSTSFSTSSSNPTTNCDPPSQTQDSIISFVINAQKIAQTLSSPCDTASVNISEKLKDPNLSSTQRSDLIFLSTQISENLQCIPNAVFQNFTQLAQFARKEN